MAQIPPAAFVIFGGGGDLTWRKLVPALYHLWLDKALLARAGAFRPPGLRRRHLGGPEAAHFLTARDGRVWVEP